MTELLSILYKLRIFTLDELSEALKGKVKSVEALLARYKQQGWIVAIRRNTYCMKDIASGLPVCDKYEIGSHMSPTACMLKTEDIHPPKTGISVHFSGSLV